MGYNQSDQYGHADYQDILTWLKNFETPPQKVFITHGEPKQALALKTKIEDEFGWKCDIPAYLQVEKLDT